MRLALLFGLALILLITFAYFNWGGTGCTEIPGVSYKDLQACLSRTKNYSDYVTLPPAAKEGKAQRVSFQSIGSECRLYISIDTVVENAVQKWSDYCIVSDPKAFKNCMETAPAAAQAECSEYFTR